MKKLYPFAMLALMAAFIFSATLSAQETKVTVKVEKDGKVIKDTTYSFDDAKQAKDAMKMMEYHTEMMEHHGDHSNTYVFISEDGEKTEIKSMSGDSHVWVSEGEEHGDHVQKKIKVMISDDEDGEWEVISSDEKEVKVIIVTKSGGDHEELEFHEIHEHEECEEMEVEVEVEKEVKKKKSKKQ